MVEHYRHLRSEDAQRKMNQIRFLDRADVSRPENRNWFHVPGVDGAATIRRETSKMEGLSGWDKRRGSGLENATRNPKICPSDWYRRKTLVARSY